MKAQFEPALEDITPHYLDRILEMYFSFDVKDHEKAIKLIARAQVLVRELVLLVGIEETVSALKELSAYKQTDHPPGRSALLECEDLELVLTSAYAATMGVQPRIGENTDVGKRLSGLRKKLSRIISKGQTKKPSLRHASVAK